MTPVHPFWLLDVVDILIVAALFYRLLSLVRGTRSAQMIVGLLLIAAVGFVAVVVIQLVPVHVGVGGGGSVSCGSPYGLSTPHTGVQAFASCRPAPAQARFGALAQCGVKLRRRRAAALVLGGLLDLPLVYWAIRGFMWGGRSIALLRQRAEGG